MQFIDLDCVVEACKNTIRIDPEKLDDSFNTIPQEDGQWDINITVTNSEHGIYRPGNYLAVIQLGDKGKKKLFVHDLFLENLMEDIIKVYFMENFDKLNSTIDKCKKLNPLE